MRCTCRTQFHSERRMRVILWVVRSKPSKQVVYLSNSNLYGHREELSGSGTTAESLLRSGLAKALFPNTMKQKQIFFVPVSVFVFFIIFYFSSDPLLVFFFSFVFYSSSFRLKRNGFFVQEKLVKGCCLAALFPSMVDQPHPVILGLW